MVQSKLHTLWLDSCSITDSLMHYFYILDINFQLRKVWLNEINEITDSSIYLLLTSTEFRSHQI